MNDVKRFWGRKPLGHKRMAEYLKLHGVLRKWVSILSKNGPEENKPVK